ncbi:MAG TPA: hypothetical protein VFK69_08790, partial [Candidatus Eisenbacteria bacterium]|nr:hypothetical protein [Candidatus Eisenbacteria bacterium]
MRMTPVAIACRYARAAPAFHLAPPALALAGLALVMLVGPARGQEFDPVLPAGGSALGFVSAGLPPAGRATRVECSATRWDGLPELTAGALALHLARRDLHVGLAL